MISWFPNPIYMKFLIQSFPLLAFLLFFPGLLKAQKFSSLAVPDYGNIRRIPESVQPDPSIKYKIVVDVSTSSDDPGLINPGLYNLARLMNLHVAGGVSLENLKVTVALHGGATFSTLNNKGYQKKYGRDNPNVEIIDQLKDAGVQLFICGQSLHVRNNGLKNINPQIDISLSAMTIVSEYQAKGYSLLIFD